MNATVLVVDDERSFRLLAEEILASEGFEVRTAATLARARAELEKSTPDVVILDRRLPDGDGIDFLRALGAEESSSPVVIVVTAHGDVGNAVEAMRAGAADYLTKPVPVADLVVKLRKVLENRGLRDRLALAGAGATRPAPVEPRSEARRALRAMLERVAQSPDTPVLITGPSGAGKQYLAETLHSLTYARVDRTAPFVEINCAAIPRELVESELFGHEKGAFTDAQATRRGVIELAEGGTLFLDEITELPPAAQAKLLKFMDSMRFRRVGGERELTVRLRVVGATNRDLAQEIREGRLREDFYHRLAVFTIGVPALHEGAEDIPELAAAFVRFFAQRVNKHVSGIAPDALALLERYRYPGNIRELRNIIERAVILAAGPELRAQDIVLPAPQAAPPGPGFFSVRLDTRGMPPALKEVERTYVGRVLDLCGGHRGAAAEALGISYPTFLTRLRELGID